MIVDLIYMGNKLPKGIKTIDFDTACEQLLWQYFKAYNFVYVYEMTTNFNEVPTTDELRILLKKFQKDVLDGKPVLNLPWHKV